MESSWRLRFTRKDRRNVNEIRRLVRQRPCKPLVFHLDNGEKQSINHPGAIITEMMIVSVDDDGQLIYIDPEAVSAVRYATIPSRRPRGGRKSTRSKS